MNLIKNTLKLLMGVSLFLLSLAVIKYTILVGLLAIVISNIYKRRFFEGIARIGDVLMSAAYCLDVFGCVVLQVPLQFSFTRKGGHRFGDKHQTISYVLGKNSETETLSLAGRWLVRLLNFLHENHCKIAVQIFDERNNC
jgi:hypothetical protein